MSRDFVNATCGALPGADYSEPFGPGTAVWKVGAKIFAAVGSEDRGVSVKCPDVETADMLKDAGVAQKAAYFHKSWVFLPFGQTDDAEFAHRIHVSYDTIRASLTKKVQATLAPRD